MTAGEGFELRELDVDELRRRPRPSDDAQLEALGVLLEAGLPIDVAQRAGRQLAAGVAPAAVLAELEPFLQPAEQLQAALVVELAEAAVAERALVRVRRPS